LLYYDIDKLEGFRCMTAGLSRCLSESLEVAYFRDGRERMIELANASAAMSDYWLGLSSRLLSGQQSLYLNVGAGGSDGRFRARRDAQVKEAGYLEHEPYRGST
jgi:hypothetical protein